VLCIVSDGVSYRSALRWATLIGWDLVAVRVFEPASRGGETEIECGFGFVVFIERPSPEGEGFAVD
jgi:hypothetical protein